MTLPNRNLFIIPLLLFSFAISAQVHDTIRAKYFVQHDQVGILDRKFERNLKKMDLVHPSKYFELSLEQTKKENFNEASVTFYLGLMKYLVYNETNPDHEESGDGALLSSLMSISFQPISEFLSSNLDNHAFVLKKAIALQSSDKQYFFESASSDSASSHLIKYLSEFQQELELSPDTYISTHENPTYYDVDLEELYEDIPLEEEMIVASEIIEKEDTNRTIKRKQSANYPSAFIELERKYIVQGEPTYLRVLAHGYDDTYVECSNGKVYPKDNPVTFELIADSVGICAVTIYGVGPTRRAALAKYHFQVLEKPDIFLSVGNIISGRTLTGNNYTLTCDELRYFRFKDFTSKYIIQSWEMTLNDIEFKGEGSELSKEAIQAIEKGNTDDSILIKVKVLNPNNAILSVKGIFLR